jgi:hypothetical protein
LINRYAMRILTNQGKERLGMRRKDKEISDTSGIDAIIKKATVCRLGMVNGNNPYIVPLCFGFQDNVLYFHSALKGQKIEYLRNNPNVSSDKVKYVIMHINSSLSCLVGLEPDSWNMKSLSV